GGELELDRDALASLQQQAVRFVARRTAVTGSAQRCRPTEVVRELALGAPLCGQVLLQQGVGKVDQREVMPELVDPRVVRTQPEPGNAPAEVRRRERESLATKV